MRNLTPSFPSRPSIRKEHKVITHTDPTTGIVIFEAKQKDGQLHCDDAPAFIERDEATGVVIVDRWFKDGKGFEPSAEVRAAWLEKSGERIAPPSPAANPGPAPG